MEVSVTMASPRIVRGSVAGAIRGPTRLSFFAVGLALALVGLAPEKASASIQFTLSASNFLPDGGNYGTVTLSDSNDGLPAGQVRIVFAVNPARTGDTFQDFVFNSTVPLTAANIISVPTGWTTSFGQNEDGFGSFSVNVQGQGANERVATGTILVSRTGLTLNNLVAPSSGNASEGNALFAGHLIPGSGSTTGFVATPVGAVPIPEPSTVVAAVTGLLPLGLLTLRRRRSS
jgi:hypothetical protein